MEVMHHGNAILQPRLQLLEVVGRFPQGCTLIQVELNAVLVADHIKFVVRATHSNTNSQCRTDSREGILEDDLFNLVGGSQDVPFHLVFAEAEHSSYFSKVGTFAYISCLWMFGRSYLDYLCLSTSVEKFVATTPHSLGNVENLQA